MARSGETAVETRDGRVRRGEANRERILQALYELVGEGTLRPTAEQVAQRAGVGERTVFRHFEDMETLFGELRERVEREVGPQISMEPATGDFEARLREFARGRARTFERIAPFKRSERIHRWSSPVMQDAHATMLRRLRKHLVASLPEVESVSPEVRQAIEALTGFEAWDQLRSDQGLGVARAEETVRETLRALLAPPRD